MKLSVLEIVREAYGFLWQRRGTFWALAIPGIIILSVLSVLSIWLMGSLAGGPGSYSGFLGPREHQIQSGSVGATVLTMLINFVFYVGVSIAYSVAWHRAYLVPAETVTIGSAYRWRTRQTRFLLGNVRIFGTIVLVMLLLGTILGIVITVVGNASQILLIQIVYALIGVYIFARFSMLLPASAVDRPMRFLAAWRMTAGNGWRILAIVILVALPMMLVSFPVNFAIDVIWFETGVGASLTGNLILTLVYHFLVFIGLAVGVSALSIAYQRLTAAAPAPGT